MFALAYKLLSKLPAVEEVEKPFKAVRFILWNLFELLLLVIAMIAIGCEALTHIPPFRSWFNPPTVISASPPPPSSTGKPILPILPPQDQSQMPLQKPRRHRRPCLQAIPIAMLPNRTEVPDTDVVYIAVQAGLDMNAPEYVSADTPSAADSSGEVTTTKRQPNRVIRAIKLPVRGVKFVAGGITKLFRNHQVVEVAGETTKMDDATPTSEK